jgi:hypothetical protein
MATRPPLVLCSVVACALVSCSLAQRPVHVVDPGSACETLRRSYPSAHGLLLFEGSTMDTRSIPLCFPASSGFGVMGHNLQVLVARPGDLSIVLSEISPPTEFALWSIAAACAADATGKSMVQLGRGTQWSLKVEPGEYCLSMFRTANREADVWFTLTVTRP